MATALSPADRAAHELASYVRPVLAEFPAGHPRGSWPAEEYADRLRAEGRTVRVIMSLDEDAFLVTEPTAGGGR
jgi:hypothetical protein